MSGAERRQWPRIPASLLSNLTASITAGPDVKLVNLSRGGALMEVAARYPMRSKVRLKLARPGGVITQVNGTVSWAKVASISNGKINYLLAVIFENPIEDLATATGLEDIENQAGVLMVTDPFEDTDAPAAALTSTTIATAEAPVAASPPISDPEPESVEEDLSDAIFPSRGVLTPFPSVDVTTIESAPAANGGRADELRRELDRAAGDLAELSAANDNLSAQLQAYDEDRIRWRSELEAARVAWEDEKSALTRETVQAVARMHELHAALELHQQSGGQALAEQQSRAQTLATRLDTLEVERASLRNDLTADRQQWESERAALAREAADAVARANELQAGVERRDRESEQALAEARALHQALQNRLEPLEAERAGWFSRLNGERQSWQDERAALVGARAHQQELESRLAALDAERAEGTGRLDHERETWQQERQALESAVQGAQARVAELQAGRHADQQAHATVLEEARTRFDHLQARFAAAESERADWAARLESERHAWHEERIALAAAAATAAAAVTALEASIHERHTAHAQAMDVAQAHQHELRAQFERRLAKVEAEGLEWQASREAERAAWTGERAGLLQQADAAGARTEALEEELRERHTEHLRVIAEQQAIVLSLSTRIEVFDDERLQMQRALETERARRDVERAEFLAEASSRSAEFQAALDAREQLHAEAIAREQTKFEELVAELMQAANDQQAEYQQLMAERTAAFEEQVSRVERVHAELARVRGEFEDERAALDAHCRQLEARAAAAEALSVAHETRHREVCREAERLVALLASAPAPAVVDPQATLFTGEGERAQAVA